MSPLPPSPLPPSRDADARDPGLRFVAPAGRPTFAGAHALDVLAAAGLPPRLDRSMAIAWLAWAHYSSSRSFYEGLGIVAPGVEVARGPDGVLGFRSSGPARRAPVSVEGAADALRGALVDATADAIAGARAVGIPLSGGLDSSAVAVCASDAWRALGRDPAALRFYHELPRSGPSEVAHARAVAAHLGHVLVELESVEGDPFVGDEVLRASLEIPTDGGGMANELRMAMRMREDGVEVVLTGDGGDEAVGPIGGRLPAAGWRARGVRGLRRVARSVLGPARDRMRRRRFLATLPGWLAELARDVPTPDMRPVAREGLSGEQAARDQALRCARQVAIVEGWRGLGRVGGFAVAHPFLDARVLDLVVSLPPVALASGRVEKGLLRRALTGRLPETVRVRPKDQPALEGQLEEEIRRYGASWLERDVRGSALEREGLVTLPRAEETLRAVRAGEPESLNRALALVGLCAWCRLRGVAIE